jgi:hypothetical protein
MGGATAHGFGWLQHGDIQTVQDGIQTCTTGREWRQGGEGGALGGACHRDPPLKPCPLVTNALLNDVMLLDTMVASLAVPLMYMVNMYAAPFRSCGAVTRRSAGWVVRVGEGGLVGHGSYPMVT